MGPGRRRAHGGGVLKIALWTPEPEARWLRALRPHLERDAQVEVVGEPPRQAVAADRHLYHLAGGPAHGFVFRALLARPGVLLLEEWDLHRLLHAETSGRGDPRAFRGAARRAAGDTGAFVAGLVERGVAGEVLPLRLALAGPALDAAAAVAAFTRDVRDRVAARRPGRPLARVPLPLLAPGPPVDRAEARGALAPAPDRPLVAVLPAPGALARERVGHALAPLRADARVDVRDLPPAGDGDRDRLLAAADVLVALEHPSSGRLDPAVGAALHAGVATLVTAGSTAALELPEGVVARVSPGDTEAAELRALVLRFATDPALRSRVGALARAHASAQGDPAAAAARLLALARDVNAREAALGAPEGGGFAAAALDEADWVSRSAGLLEAPADVRALAEGLGASGGAAPAPGGR